MNFRLTPAVKNILIANFVMFFLTNFLGERNQSILLEYFAITSDGLFGSFRIYQLITYQFLHANFGHIFGNMLLLFFLGSRLEEMWGTKRFYQVYLTAGAFAGLLQILISPDGLVFGASGSVMAVFAAFALYYPNQEMLIYFLFPVKIKYLFLFYLAGDLAGVLPNSGSEGIAHFAHLGGILASFIYVKYIDKRGYSGGQSSSNYSSKSMFDSFKKSFKTAAKKPNMSYKNSNDVYNVDKLKHFRKVVDELLDKINRVGYLQLSSEERRQLEEASDYLKKFDSH